MPAFLQAAHNNEGANCCVLIRLRNTFRIYNGKHVRIAGVRIHEAILTSMKMIFMMKSQKSTQKKDFGVRVQYT